jgi:hypothetical protein
MQPNDERVGPQRHKLTFVAHAGIRIRGLVREEPYSDPCPWLKQGGVKRLRPHTRRAAHNERKGRSRNAPLHESAA